MTRTKKTTTIPGIDKMNATLLTIRGHARVFKFARTAIVAIANPIMGKIATTSAMTASAF
jgi:hypothetical protein